MKGGKRALLQRQNGRLLGIPLVAGVVVFALIVALLEIIFSQHKAQLLTQDRELLNELRGELQSELNRAASVSSAVASMVIATDGQPDPQAVDVLASRMLVRNPAVRLVAIAPDNTVTQIVPVAGNEAVLGVDLSLHPEQAGSLERARDKRQPVFGGPYQLIQEDIQALIHRVPIYLPDSEDEVYWGLISTPISLPELFERAGATDLFAEERLAMRFAQSVEQNGVLVAGNRALFSKPGSLKTKVNAIDGTWQLSLKPRADLMWTTWAQAIAFVFALFIALVVGVLAYRWQRQQAWLAESEALLRDITEHITEVVFRTDCEDNLLYLSPAYQQLTGISVEQGVNRPWLRLFTTNSRSKARGIAQRIRGESHYQPQPFSADLLDQNGDLRPVEVYLNGVWGEQKHFTGMVGVLIDRSERAALTRLQTLTEAVFSATADGIVLLDHRRCLITANPGFARLVAAGDPAELEGRRLTKPPLVHKPLSFWLQAARQLRRDGHWRGELKTAEQPPRVLQWAVDVIELNAHTRRQYVAIVTDVTTRHHQFMAMTRQAEHDPLTGLLNRAGLKRVFANTEKQSGLMLAFVDLDGFKPVNDAFGHEQGDYLLQILAKRLTHITRTQDAVARVGGDEFVVLFADVAGDTHTLADKLGQKIIATLAEPVVIAPGAKSEARVQVGASVGFALFPEHGQELEALLRKADHAMYRIKYSGKGRAAVYQE